jgi:plasmid maintenance system antidote protein VapI
MTANRPEALRLSQAARALGVETREIASLVHGRRIAYVMIDGIAHIPCEAIEEFRTSGQ